MHTSSIWSAWVRWAQDELEVAVPGGRHQRELEALVLLQAHPGVGQEWLRERIGLTQPGTARLIDRLVQQDLVRRTRPGRSLALEPPAAGREVVAEWDRARDTALDQVTAGVTAKERDALLELLGRALLHRERTRREADRVCRTCDWTRCSPCPVDRSVASG